MFMVNTVPSLTPHSSGDDHPGDDCSGVSCPSLPLAAQVSADLGKLNPGEPVQVHSLRSRPELNGADAHLLNYDGRKGKWGVKFAGTGHKALLKPANLRSCAAAREAAPGLTAGGQFVKYACDSSFDCSCSKDRGTKKQISVAALMTLFPLVTTLCPME